MDEPGRTVEVGTEQVTRKEPNLVQGEAFLPGFALCPKGNQAPVEPSFATIVTPAQHGKRANVRVKLTGVAPAGYAPDSMENVATFTGKRRQSSRLSAELFILT